MFRYQHEYDKYGWAEGNYGGWTIAFDVDNRLIGISVCSPKDQFNKKLGRLVAEERAHMASGDGRMWLVSLPAVSGKVTTGLAYEALSYAVSFIVERYPNTEFGVQYV